MPELPEVETVLRTLEYQIKDQKINDIKILYPKIIDGDLNEFKEKLINQHFRRFIRRGKYLIFELDDYTLVSHLRMEGKYYLEDFNDEIKKHTHIIFKLDKFDLRYHDVRKFGRMEVIEKKDDYNIFKKLGVEPFSEQFTYNYVKNYLSKSKKMLKEELLNQSFIAGIGNIYADEIAYLMKVSPYRKANLLTDKEVENLVLYTNIVLKKAIKLGGTTIKSYTSSLGVNGLFQLELNVHTLVNKPCKNCGELIKKNKLKGRGTYYCEKCQK